MKSFLISSIFLLFFFRFCFAQAYWEGSEFISDGVRQPLIIHASKEEAKVLKSRWAVIGEEINSTENLSAGTYAKVGYRGYYLRFAPKNGFVFIYHYEDIDVVNYSYGKVEIKGAEITFIPEREMKVVGRDDESLRTPLKWVLFGGTFVEANKVNDYADYLTGLGSYNDWNCECMAFFGKTSKNKSPEYLIPAKYKAIFRPPIEGKITFVGKEKLFRRKDRIPEIETQIKINVGKNQGVNKGMIFRFSAGKEVEREMTVIQVELSSSLALITDGVFEEEKGLFATYYDSKTETDKPLPRTKVGTKISTKLFPWVYGED